MVIERTVVNRMATALVELSNIHSVTDVLEGGDALILLHHAACGERAKYELLKTNSVNLIEAHTPSICP